jgi:hypothetical protein
MPKERRGFKPLRIEIPKNSDAVVTHFNVFFSYLPSNNYDPDSDSDDEDCDGRAYSCLIRLSFGPVREEANKPLKRGVSMSTWCATSHEPAARRFEGLEIDVGNEIIMSQGTEVMLKIPEIESREACGFPGLGIWLEWPVCSNPYVQYVLVLPLFCDRTTRASFSRLSHKKYSRCECLGAPCHQNTENPAVPDYVPKRPPATITSEKKDKPDKTDKRGDASTRPTRPTRTTRSKRARELMDASSS